MIFDNQIHGSGVLPISIYLHHRTNEGAETLPSHFNVAKSDPVSIQTHSETLPGETQAGNPPNQDDNRFLRLFLKMERVDGIEPTYAAWKAAVLPLNYTR